jgi:hypothetical protein
MRKVVSNNPRTRIPGSLLLFLIVEVNTGQAVSHKVVRTWLKSKGYAAASNSRPGRMR